MACGSSALARGHSGALVAAAVELAGAPGAATPGETADAESAAERAPVAAPAQAIDTDKDNARQRSCMAAL
jgi:hypothetical protein